MLGEGIAECSQGSRRVTEMQIAPGQWIHDDLQANCKCHTQALRAGPESIACMGLQTLPAYWHRPGHGTANIVSWNCDNRSTYRMSPLEQIYGGGCSKPLQRMLCTL